MKATGIVRRIDDLGRIVIPKEIRKTLRIKDGDPMEIYTTKEGEVIFRKYSLLGGLSEFSQQVCDVLHRSTGRTAVVADRDVCLAVAGAPRRELVDKLLSEPLERSIQSRQFYHSGGDQPPMALTDHGGRLGVICSAPVLSEGDVLGAVLLAGESAVADSTEAERQLVQVMADFLGRQMEM